jgi:hypothetical protein
MGESQPVGSGNGDGQAGDPPLAASNPASWDDDTQFQGLTVSDGQPGGDAPLAAWSDGPAAFQGVA